MHMAEENVISSVYSCSIDQTHWVQTKDHTHKSHRAQGGSTHKAREAPHTKAREAPHTKAREAPHTKGADPLSTYYYQEQAHETT